MSVSIQLHDDGILTLFGDCESLDDVPLQLDLDSTDQKHLAAAIVVAQGLRAEEDGVAPDE